MQNNLTKLQFEITPCESQEVGDLLCNQRTDADYSWSKHTTVYTYTPVFSSHFRSISAYVNGVAIVFKIDWYQYLKQVCCQMISVPYFRKVCPPGIHIVYSLEKLKPTPLLDLTTDNFSDYDWYHVSLRWFYLFICSFHNCMYMADSIHSIFCSFLFSI
jgi:hypothetical protein